MKSAKEWEKEMPLGSTADRFGFIQQVQSDALRHAFKIAQEDGSYLAAFAIDEAARDLEEDGK